MNFTILTLTTMFMMVYAASLCKTKGQLLDDILQSASSLEKQVTELGWRNKKVKMISDVGPTCVKGFFCLAKKALVDANISSANVPDAERLIDQLTELNTKSGNTNCTLTTTNKYNLRRLFKDIMECTEQCKEQLIKCV